MAANSHPYRSIFQPASGASAAVDQPHSTFFTSSMDHPVMWGKFVASQPASGSANANTSFSSGQSSPYSAPSLSSSSSRAHPYTSSFYKDSSLDNSSKTSPSSSVAPTSNSSQPSRFQNLSTGSSSQQPSSSNHTAQPSHNNGSSAPSSASYPVAATFSISPIIHAAPSSPSANQKQSAAPSQPAQVAVSHAKPSKAEKIEEKSFVSANNPFAALDASSASSSAPSAAKKASAEIAAPNYAQAAQPAPQKAQQNQSAPEVAHQAPQPAQSQAKRGAAAAKPVFVPKEPVVEEPVAAKIAEEFDPAADRRKLRQNQPNAKHTSANASSSSVASSPSKAQPAKAKGSFGGPAAPQNASPYAKKAANAPSSGLPNLASVEISPAPAKGKKNSAKNSSASAAAVPSSSAPNNAKQASSSNNQASSNNSKPKKSSAKAAEETRPPISPAHTFNGIKYQEISHTKWNGLYITQNLDVASQEDECAICFDPFGAGASVVTIFGCHCRYHQKCINGWWNKLESDGKQPHCPTHRTVLAEAIKAGLCKIGFIS